MSGTAASGHKRRFHSRMNAVMPLILVICSLLVIILQVMALACDCDDYGITFSGSSFNGTDTTFYYDIQVCCGLLKHWVLETPSCVVESDVKDAGTVSGGSDWDWKDPDGATYLTGVMLREDVEYVSGDCITRSFYVSLEGNWVSGSTQAGLNYDGKPWDESCNKTTTGPVTRAPVAQDDSDTTDEDVPVTIDVLANDSDVDGDDLTVQSVTQPADGAVLNNATDVTYTPDPDFHGVDSFTYIASDGNGGTAEATVTVTVTPVNDLPIAQDDSDTTDEDVPVMIDVLANDSDVDGDDLTVQSVTQPADGAVLNNATDVTYTPDPDFHGVDTFTYTVSDGSGGTDTATVAVAVATVNDPPIAQDDSPSTDEDVPVVIDLLANDDDLDGDLLNVESVTQPANGTVANNGSDVSYTPDANFNGSDTFTYTVSDGNGGTDTATVMVTVASVNDPPVASDDSAITLEDVLVGIDVVVNDSDIDGTIDPTTVAIAQQPLSGSAIVNRRTGKVTYTPAAGYSGLDTFTYTVMDNDRATSNEATVNVSVTMVFYTLTTQVSPIRGGTIIPAVGVHDYRRDTVVEVEATAKPGYQFDHWEAELSGSANPTSITMASDKTIRAIFFAMEPSLGIVKEASDTIAAVGDTITYTYIVINTGNVALTDVSVTDDLLGAIDLGATTLAPGERTMGLAVYTVQESDPPWPIVNVARAVGISPDKRIRTEASMTTVVQPIPSVEPAIVMAARGEPTSAHVGEEVRYTYTVTNIGDVPLRDVGAVDSLVGLITLGTSSLAPGGSTEGTASYIVQRSDLPGPLSSVATATATDTFGLVATVQVTTTVFLTEDLASGDETSGRPGRGGVDISELPWVGTATNQRDESIELHDLGAVLGMAAPADFDDVLMTVDLESIECRPGEPLVAELAVRRGDMKEHGWPVLHIAQPDLTPPTGEEDGAECADGFSFAGHSSENTYWLVITVGDCLPGRYHVWIVCAGKTVLVPIIMVR